MGNGGHVIINRRDFLKIGIAGGGVAGAAAKLFKLQKRYNEYARAGFPF